VRIKGVCMTIGVHCADPDGTTDAVKAYIFV